jgi:hypothetical protein
MPTWGEARTAIVNAIYPVASLAQIVAVVIAGFWAYHMHLLTGEGDLDPEVWVSTQTVPYNKDTRLLVVHIREKNVGKIPVQIKPDALTLTVRKLPDALSPGYIKTDSKPALFEEKHLLARYPEGLYLSPGTEQEDIAQFVVAPGLYTVEAVFALTDGDTVSHEAFQRVE